MEIFMRRSSTCFISLRLKTGKSDLSSIRFLQVYDKWLQAYWDRYRLQYKGIGYWRTENKGVESFLTDSLNDSMKI